MNPDEISHPGGLTDSDLDRILAAANKDLLAHIEAAAYPNHPAASPPPAPSAGRLPPPGAVPRAPGTPGR